MTDNETGLPELPEGYFWRVTHGKSATVFGHLIPDESKLDVHLMEAKTWSYERTIHGFFRSKRVTQESTQEVTVLTAGALGTKPIAIRNAANKLLKRWELVKEREALIGDYPPKKLEFTDD